MSHYRRLISYIYAYEGGVREKNTGFAKIEVRGDQCRIYINVKKVYVGSNDIGVYLLSPGAEILLGRIFIRGGAGEFRISVNGANIEGSGCTMEECYGLTIHDVESTWQCYTTIWEDAVTQAAETTLAEITAEQIREKREETLSGGAEDRCLMDTCPMDTCPTKVPPLPEEKPRFPISEEIERELELEAMRLEAQAPWESEDDGGKEAAGEPEVLKQPGETGVPVTPKQPGETRVPEMTEQPGETGVPKAPKQPEVTEQPEAKGVPVAPKQPGEAGKLQATGTAGGGSQTEGKSAQRKKTDAIRLLRPAGQPGPLRPPKPADRSPEPAARSQEPPASAKSADNQPAPAPVRPDDNPSPPEPEDAAKLQELDRMEQEELTQNDLWNQLQRRYTKVLAFDYDNGCEILSIKPQDIGLLPREIWVFGNNSFLLHGYYNYRHLILARLNNPHGNPRYLLGVPGHYFSNEKYMASMFGFPHFVLARKQPENDGRFGYWYTDIRL